jgi:hypothetical protein
MAWSLRTLILAAQDAPLARSIATALAPASTAGMWTTGLSPTGEAPATHYVSSGHITPEFADMCPLAVFERDAETGEWMQTAYTPANAQVVAMACSMADPPLAVTPAQIEGIFKRADVTEQDPWVVFDRLGLRMVTEQVTLER